MVGHRRDALDFRNGFYLFDHVRDDGLFGNQEQRPREIFRARVEVGGIPRRPLEETLAYQQVDSGQSSSVMVLKLQLRRETETYCVRRQW